MESPPANASSWPVAVSATLHCLTGCAIGEVSGLIIGSLLGLGTQVTIILAIGLAFLFGYGLSMLPLLRHALSFKQAVPVVLAADTVSIISMELVDNAIMLGIPGAMDARLGDWLFWASMAVALAVAFVITVPVNKYLIDRGKGHAVVHRFHHHE